MRNLHLDHVFVCTAAGAAIADVISQIGLTEGSPNRHAGQGTACRRFFFENAMLELLWVVDREEAQRPGASRLRLWERWSKSPAEASPFGVILRPEEPAAGSECPFPSWIYAPPAMAPFQLNVALGAALIEPMWCWLPTGRPPAKWPEERRQPLVHRAGMRHVTAVGITSPPLDELALTRKLVSEVAGMSWTPATEHHLTLTFDAAVQGRRVDLRPALPLTLEW